MGSYASFARGNLSQGDLTSSSQGYGVAKELSMKPSKGEICVPYLHWFVLSLLYFYQT